MLKHYPLALAPMACHLALVAAGACLGRYGLPHAPDWGALQSPAIAQAPAWMQPLLQWDAHWYTQIAAEGYNPKSAAFFPLMPVLAALLAEATGLPVAAAGWLLGNVCGILALLVAPAAFAPYLERRLAVRATWLLALLPTSFYLNTFYTEPLFLLCTLAAFYYAPQGRVWPTALATVGATLTRNTGLALLLWVGQALIVRYRRQGLSLKLGLTGVAALALPAAGLGLFMLFGQAAFYDPLAFVTAQASFGRQACWPGTGLWLGLRQLAAWGFVPTAGRLFLFLGVALQGAALLAWATIARQAWRQPLWRWGCGLAAVWLLVPLTSCMATDPLQSISRYVLVNVPLYLAVSLLPTRAYLLWCLASALGLLLATALFAQGWWVA